MKQNNAHLFACYMPSLSTLLGNKEIGEELAFFDKPLWHRLTRVLRLPADSLVILFDNRVNLTLKLGLILAGQQAYVRGTIEAIAYQEALTPHITLALGLLKRPALAEAAYLATQMGVTTFIPLLTEKIQQRWEKDRDTKKLLNIAIAAAEQSKNYTFPLFQEAMSLPIWLKTIAEGKVLSKKVFFDPHGEPLLPFLQEIASKHYQSLIVVVGPEGGLTLQEQNMLIDQGFEKIALTPTILRSVEAVAVGIGSLRSCVN